MENEAGGDFMKTILIILAIIFLPAIIFKFVDPKKLGQKLDNTRARIKAYDREKNHIK
jgi:hypothetical protein